MTSAAHDPGSAASFLYEPTGDEIEVGENGLKVAGLLAYRTIIRTW
jgi:hypothetical protein